jgi:hypothetical protein
MTVSGFTALQIILASGFPGVTELGHIPAQVIELASLPEPVSLVRATEGINFKLAAKVGDPVRQDTSIFPWLVQLAPSVVQFPDYFLPGGRGGTFQVLKRVQPIAKYPDLQFVRLPIKFVPGNRSKSKVPELWLSTIVLHTEESALTEINRGTRIGA